MVTSFWVSVPFRKTEVDDVNSTLHFTSTDQKVVRLDISVDVMTSMHTFHSVNHSFCKHAGGLDCEFALAVFKKIL